MSTAPIKNDLVFRIMCAMDRGLRCCVEDFLGTPLFIEAAKEAGGHWQDILDEREGDDEEELS